MCTGPKGWINRVYKIKRRRERLIERIWSSLIYFFAFAIERSLKTFEAQFFLKTLYTFPYCSAIHLSHHASSHPFHCMHGEDWLHSFSLLATYPTLRSVLKITKASGSTTSRARSWRLCCCFCFFRASCFRSLLSVPSCWSTPFFPACFASTATSIFFWPVIVLITPERIILKEKEARGLRRGARSMIITDEGGRCYSGQAGYTVAKTILCQCYSSAFQVANTNTNRVVTSTKQVYLTPIVWDFSLGRSPWYSPLC